MSEVKRRVVREVRSNRADYEDGVSTELEFFPQAGIVFDVKKRPDYLPPKPNHLPDILHLARIRAELRMIRRHYGKR